MDIKKNVRNLKIKIIFFIAQATYKKQTPNIHALYAYKLHYLKILKQTHKHTNNGTKQCRESIESIIITNHTQTLCV
jgi:hypothetical protein